MNNQLTQENKDEQIQKIYNALPIYAQNAMSSEENAEINGKIAAKYGLSGERVPRMVRLIGHTILKVFPVADLPKQLADHLSLQEQVAKDMSLDIAIKRFLPLRNHLPEVTDFIKSIGGQLPATLPPALEDKAIVPASTTKQSTSEPFIETDVLTAINQREEAANQKISNDPIKFEDSDAMRLPSIKNWLIDYKKFKSRFPDEDLALLRIKYVHESANCKNINEEERYIVNEIIKSYDERSILPFSQKTGLLLTEKVLPKKSPQQQAPPATAAPPQKQKPEPFQFPQQPVNPPPQTKPTQPVAPSIVKAAAPPAPGPSSTKATLSETPELKVIYPGAPNQKPQINTVAPPPAALPQKDTYREQPTQTSSTSPPRPVEAGLPQAPRPAAPKIDGNIVDLKNPNNNAV